MASCPLQFLSLALYLGLGEHFDAIGSEELLGPQGQLLRLGVQGLWETAGLRWGQVATVPLCNKGPGAQGGWGQPQVTWELPDQTQQTQIFKPQGTTDRSGMNREGSESDPHRATSKTPWA